MTHLSVFIRDGNLVAIFPQVVHERVSKQVRLGNLEGDHHVLLHAAFVLQQLLQTLMQNLAHTGQKKNPDQQLSVDLNTAGLRWLGRVLTGLASAKSLNVPFLPMSFR